MGARFDYAQAEEIRDVFARHGVRYLFLGKSGAILLGFPDTTQDADVFVERTMANGLALVAALRELGFTLTDAEADEIARGKHFVQPKNGPLVGQRYPELAVDLGLHFFFLEFLDFLGGRGFLRVRATGCFFFLERVAARLRAWW